MPWKDPLLFLIQIGDIAGTENLLREGQSVNGSINGSPSPLLLAVQESNYDICRMLVSYGADVNKQDYNGSSALHKAVSKQGSEHIVRLLLTNKGCVDLFNTFGQTPLDLCAFQGSVEMCMAFLELEEEHELLDCEGNSLLHRLMEFRLDYDPLEETSDDDEDYDINSNDDDNCDMRPALPKPPENDTCNIEAIYNEEDRVTFWTEMCERIRYANVNINVKNDECQTPLHYAARSFRRRIEAIEMILTTLPAVDPTIHDKHGNNFLHDCFVHSDVTKTSKQEHFIIKLLKGELAFCSQSIIKTLINSRNVHGWTPFLAALDKDGDLKSDFLNVLLNAGADVNISDNLGRAALHYLVGRDFIDTDCEDEKENIELLIANGAAIDWQDQNGESAIFLAERIQGAKTLLSMGANTRVQDKAGRTPLMAQIKRNDNEILEAILEEGGSVDSEDHCGSNVLHYAAYHDSSDLIDTLLSRGANGFHRDKKGRLPCELAYHFGNMTCFQRLCSCDFHEEHALGRMNLAKRQYSYEEVIKSRYHVLEDMVNKNKPIREQISEVLTCPELGKVIIKDEAELVMSVVQSFVQHVCRRIAELDDRFENEVLQSGSVSEGTKASLPDEFDFICLLNKISDLCEVDEEKTQSDDGFAYCAMKPPLHVSYAPFFDYNFNLNPVEIRVLFYDLLNRVLNEKESWTHPNVYYTTNFLEAENSPIANFSIEFHGCLYKELDISVDLVPAFRKEGWWPQNLNTKCMSYLPESDYKKGCLLLLQIPPGLERNFRAKVRISMSPVEMSCIKALPQVALDSYIFAKVMRDNRICPEVIVSEGGRNITLSATDVMKSYMLKTCLLHLQEDIEVPTKNQSYEESVLKFTIKLFKKLLQYALKEELPSAVLPSQNVLTFQEQFIPSFDIEEDNSQNERQNERRLRSDYQVLFAKIILSMLGEY